MRIVFFGTPSFASEVLDFLLLSGVNILAVVTQPDRPRGRSLQTSFSPVKEKILSAKPDAIILQPVKASDPQFLDELKKIDADLFVVVAFGQILPQQLLDIPPKGCINLHASLLPKYRGAAPIQRALLNGEKETGVCVQKMVKQLDAGDVIAAARVAISSEMTFGQLEKELCDLSKNLLLLVLEAYEQGVPSAQVQDSTLVTYAPKISVEEREVDWSRSADEIHNQIRAFSPSPGAWCQVYGAAEPRRVKILRSKVASAKGAIGELIDSSGLVGCGAGSLQILEIQQEGKRPMSMVEWLRGWQHPPRF